MSYYFSFQNILLKTVHTFHKKKHHDHSLFAYFSHNKPSPKVLNFNLLISNIFLWFLSTRVVKITVGEC